MGRIFSEIPGVETWSRILKFTAKTFGVFMMLYGTMGIIGMGPDGPMPIGWRLIGLLSFVLGVMYWLPNEKIQPHKIIYLALTISPALALSVQLIYEVLSEGIGSTFVMDLTIVWVLITICLCLAAPISLVLYAKSKRESGTVETHIN
jgi:hypothetical protein